MNEHRTTENDELFAQVPEDDKYGMIAFVKKKKFFPNVQSEILHQIRVFRQERW
jgi:hypothetical protein